MRRQNRSIEVFDISLMAVVTKAMGAFLVLMLLLMPYYSSGPVGEQNAAALAQALAEAQEKLRAATAAGADANDLARLLREAQQRLADAQRSMTQLKRDNDALNGQAKRLEDNLQQAKAEQTQAEQKIADLSKLTLTGHLLNWDCPDTQLELGLVNKGTHLVRESADRSHFLTFTSSLGNAIHITDDDILAVFKEEATNQPGRGYRFNQSRFRYAADPGNYYVILVGRSKARKEKDSLAYYPLKKPANDCRVIVSIDYFAAKERHFNSFLFQEARLPRTEYALILYEVAIKPDKAENVAISTDAVAWLNEQVQFAEKESDAPQSAGNVTPQQRAEDHIRRRLDPTTLERLQERSRAQRSQLPPKP